MASPANPHSSPAPSILRKVPTGGVRLFNFPALGTNCEVQYVASNGEVAAQNFERAARGWVDAFEAKYSRFRPTSLVSRINAAAGQATVEVDQEMSHLLELCDALYRMTDGVLDPTALPLIQLWNWKAAQPVIPPVEAIAAARRLVGWNKVQRTPGRIFLPHPGMALDFGGFGKEYAVDRVAQIAQEHGIENVLVDFGHDIRALGMPPGKPAWHIGIEDPQNPGRHTSSIGVSGKGVASSGDYVRSFKFNGRRYGHIIDPRTGWPVANNCTQATVIADTCLQAGILSTTAFVLGLRDGIKFIEGFPRAQGMLADDSSRAQTRGFFNYVPSA